MSISEELKLEILKYNNKKFTIKDKTDTYNIREIIKYVIYCRDILSLYKDKVGLTGISFVQPDQQETAIGYGQLEQVSFGTSFDPKMPLDSFILGVIEFMDSNNFSEDKINIVKKFIDDYNIFMQPIEFKSPIYLSIGYLCVQNTTKIKPSDTEFREIDMMDEFGGEFGGGDDDDYFSDDNYGDEFGDDEY